jgi:hypothetical protein
MQAVDAVLSSPNWDINRLLLAARDRAQQLGTAAGLPQGCAFGLNSCGTYYGVTSQGASQELLSWCLSLLLAEYTAGLLAHKAEEGHCQQHRKAPDFKPCPYMAREHMRMLSVFKDALRKLVDEIDQLEQQTHLPQPPATAQSP